jgi:hypothetical protein
LKNIPILRDYFNAFGDENERNIEKEVEIG